MLLIVLFPFLVFPITLKTTFQIATPKYMVINGKPTGVGYEIFQKLKRSLENRGIDLVWDGKFRNMEEIQSLLSSCKIDLFIGMSKTKKRMEKFNFSSYPLYSLSYVFLTRRGIRRVKKILVVGGTKTESLLLKTAPPKQFNIIRVQSVDRAVSLLDSGKADAIFYNSMSLGYIYNQNPLKYSIITHFSGKYYQFVAFSKCLRKDVREVLNKAVFEMLKSGEIKAIILNFALWNYMKPANYLIFAVSNWPPYEFTDGERWFGIDAEVVQKLFKELGFEIEIENMSLARTLESIKLGIIDGTFSISETGDRKKYMYFSSEPISVSVDGFLYRKDRFREKDLYTPMNLVCGYVPGYAYENVLNQETSLRLIPLSSIEYGVRALLAGRIDILATNKFVGMYYVRKLGEAEKVSFLPVFGKDYYYVALSKIDSYHKDILMVFSKRFEIFKHSREYERILEGYGLSYEEARIM